MDVSHTTVRGKFRSMTMEEIQQRADSPNWGKEKSVNAYRLPFRTDWFGRVRRASQVLSMHPTVIPPEELGEIGSVLTAASPQSHIGPFVTAIDFLIPDGTPVLAALDGEIVEVQEHSDAWGPSPAFRDSLNYITIRHAGDEFSQYCHLAQNSVRKSGLGIGGRVRAGQQIAVVGKTGWTDRDHLHFIVFKLVPETPENPFGFIGVQPRWS